MDDYSPKSPWAQYIWEREGKKMLERPEGFATYLFLPKHCYIEDIYVLPTARSSKVAQSLIAEVTIEAMAAGYTKLLGSAVVGKHGVNESLAMALKVGFKILEAKDNVIYYEKDI